MRKIFVALLSLTLLFTGCGDDRKSSKVKPAQQTEVQRSASLVANLPAKVSKLPSIGTTLAEFERTYTPSQTDDGLFAYGINDEFVALFFDDNFKSTSEKTARAANFAIKKKGISEASLKDYLPSDARIVKEESRDSDDVVLYKYFEGYSDMLAKVYPQSDGQWWAGFHFDKRTGEFLYGGINAEHWNE